jgi:hypothetical protein
LSTQPINIDPAGRELSAPATADLGASTSAYVSLGWRLSFDDSGHLDGHDPEIAIARSGMMDSRSARACTTITATATACGGQHHRDRCRGIGCGSPAHRGRAKSGPTRALVPTATVKLTGKPLDFRALERDVFDVMAGRARQRDGDRKPGASGGARCRPII